mgnify:FL=1|jgi:hypothetical protein|tara:strand:+ start:24270 stop:24650 length:381 start_codon:yes stop_codon:yes gene_type:complete
MGNNKFNKNVYGEAIEVCCEETMTGYLRNGLCETSDDDVGSHTVCAKVTKEFLDYSKNKGNDLITPRPEFNFPGLKEGDKWCVCAGRWLEALNDGVAPPILIKSTNAKALEIISIELLRKYAIDLL